MQKEHANILTALLACLFGLALYDLQPPKPYFYPLEGVWRWEKLSDRPAMGWYGRVAWSLIAATVGWGVGKLIFRAKPEATQGLSKSKVYFITTILLVTLLWCLARIVLHEWNALYG